MNIIDLFKPTFTVPPFPPLTIGPEEFKLMDNINKALKRIRDIDKQLDNSKK
jgi:hypothetical protein